MSLRDKPFLKRLRTELPTWVERGWVAAEHQQSILDHVARSERPSRYITIWLTIMGALLLGAGVITFFAANWGEIPKLGKLAILFAALGGAYAAAGVCLARGLNAVGEALLLLGVILFGANIFLVAQIYHIDAHYPNGILTWALGALTTAAVMRSPLAAIVGIAMTLIWSGTETLHFVRNPHFAFFLPWAAALALSYRHGWLWAWRAACWALFAWCFLTLADGEFFARRWLYGERAALVQLYVFIGIALYIVARGMSWYRQWARFAPPLVTVGAALAVVALFILSYPEIHRHVEMVPLPDAWIVATVVVLLIVAGLMVWRYIDTPLSTLPWYRQGAFGWLGVSGALVVGNLLLHGRYPGLVALIFNLLSFAGVVWLVMTGMERRERRLVNLGFAFFAALLLARYFDTFWTLLDRSFFFMGGGALMLVVGFFMERSRRRITTSIAEEGEET